MESKIVTEQLLKENDRLQKLATHDELTGIFNRRATEDIISKTMNKGGALLVCDLDNFKHINDKYGHLMGDHFLKESAKLLRYIIRQTDFLGRIGGDEFVIFAYGLRNEKELELLCRKIENRFYDQYKHERIRLSLTIGGAVYRPEDTYESLFDRADQLLLSKKEVKRLSYKHEGVEDNWLKENWWNRF